MTHPPQPLPGWYPDPAGSGGQRWWDGQRWTVQCRPPSQPRYGPLRPDASRRTVRLVVAGVAVLFVALMIAVVVSNSSNSSGRGDASGGGGAPGTSSGRGDASGGSDARGVVTGSQDQWIQSVCKLGTFFDGSRVLTDTTGSANCRAESGSIILIGQYESDFKMRNSLNILHIKYYASTIEPDGTTVVFAVWGDRDPSALEPLTKFGFTINTSSTR
jgi:hypothetical protein